MEERKYEYTDDEIEALEYYSSRKKQELAESFKVGYDYDTVNRFLRYVLGNGMRDNTISGAIPIHIRDVESFKKLLKNIENLYSLACKYGATHTIPRTLYRGDNNAPRIMTESYESMISHDKMWTSDSFLSCSRSKAETQPFVSDGGGIIQIETDDKAIEQQNIPFIDVNDLLGPNQFYGDEKEILLTPFLDTKVGYSTYGKPCDTSTYKEYNIELSSGIHLPDTYEEMQVEYTDKDLAEFLELSHQFNMLGEGKWKSGIPEQLNKLRMKLKSHLQHRMFSIHNEIMPPQEVEEIFSLDDDLGLFFKDCLADIGMHDLEDLYKQEKIEKSSHDDNDSLDEK